MLGDITAVAQSPPGYLPCYARQDARVIATAGRATQYNVPTYHLRGGNPVASLGWREQWALEGSAVASVRRLAGGERLRGH